MSQQQVLVTGATGFVGASLVLDLLRSSDAMITCLVRDRPGEDPTERLTSHLIRTAEGYEETIREIDRLAGLARLEVWHLNDALRERSSRVDRHAHIGRGKIGREGFRRLVTDPRFAEHPMIIETPKYDARDREMDPVNLRLLRRLVGQL